MSFDFLKIFEKKIYLENFLKIFGKTKKYVEKFNIKKIFGKIKTDMN